MGQLQHLIFSIHLRSDARRPIRYIVLSDEGYMQDHDIISLPHLYSFNCHFLAAAGLMLFPLFYVKVKLSKKGHKVTGNDKDMNVMKV